MGEGLLGSENGRVVTIEVKLSTEYMINTILFPTPFCRSYMYMYIMMYHVKLQNPVS
jgi:hypothetical protein